ncbi:lactonase family protein [Paenibacillus hexagrammi]|uniref:Lactonase family protein n=1 Tax=Paenibacillus hexagrammi TaxID=2908839 RepID=A0ABY3SEQ5_9BACL|nr:lactonase family protein [Paenibacillus sp. YPD9-1]UJF31903.1 lactonase family protein [Paenibacillus sp. YPD9-1]
MQLRYRKREHKGIEAYELENASYLAVDAQRHRLYAVSETEVYEGKYGGSAAAYTIDKESGKLDKLNQQPTHGAAPCYISSDATGQSVYVANYLAGNVTVFPVTTDGSLGKHSQLIQHQGTLGPNAARQEHAHAHSIVPDPRNRFAVSADLGLDRLLVSIIDEAAHKLTPHEETAMAPGAGPRHVVFTADSRFAYAVNELGSTVTVLAYNAEAGVLTPLQNVSTLPADYSGSNICADIHLSPDGRYVYASNRGHDSIAVYAVDEQRGTLSLEQLQETHGHTPRNFALSPQGDFLLAANQDSDTIVVFRINKVLGLLTEAGQTLQVPKPVCIKFL